MPGPEPTASTQRSAVMPASGVAPAASRPDARGHRGHRVLGHGDQLGPAPAADRGVGVQDEAEHVVAGGVAGDAVADPLDRAGEVAAEDDGELVLDHAGEHPGRDRVVDRVDRRGADADEQLARRGDRVRELVDGGRCLRARERDRLHALVPLRVVGGAIMHHGSACG